jgi:hypothetical protein
MPLRAALAAAILLCATGAAAYDRQDRSVEASARALSAARGARRIPA